MSPMTRSVSILMRARAGADWPRTIHGAAATILAATLVKLRRESGGAICIESQNPQYFIRRGSAQACTLPPAAEGPASRRWPEAGAEAWRAFRPKAGTGWFRSGTETAPGTALAALQSPGGVF